MQDDEKNARNSAMNQHIPELSPMNTMSKDQQQDGSLAGQTRIRKQSIGLGQVIKRTAISAGLTFCTFLIFGLISSLKSDLITGYFIIGAVLWIPIVSVVTFVVGIIYHFFPPNEYNPKIVRAIMYTPVTLFTIWILSYAIKN